MRVLFEGGNKSGAGTIQGNTVCAFRDYVNIQASAVCRF